MFEPFADNVTEIQLFEPAADAPVHVYDPPLMRLPVQM